MRIWRIFIYTPQLYIYINIYIYIYIYFSHRDWQTIRKTLETFLTNKTIYCDQFKRVVRLIHIQLSQIFDDICTSADCQITEAYKCVNELVFWQTNNRLPKWSIIKRMWRRSNIRDAHDEDSSEEDSDVHDLGWDDDSSEEDSDEVHDPGWDDDSSQEDSGSVEWPEDRNNTYCWYVSGVYFSVSRTHLIYQRKCSEKESIPLIKGP